MLKLLEAAKLVQFLRPKPGSRAVGLGCIEGKRGRGESVAGRSGFVIVAFPGMALAYRRMFSESDA